MSQFYGKILFFSFVFGAIGGLVVSIIYLGVTYRSIYDLFAHPLIITMFVVLLGKIFILDQILPQKVIDLKIETIKQIIIIRNYYKEILFVYDRIVNTVKSSEQDQRIKIADHLPPETGRMSQLVNEKIPLAKQELDTNIEFYYKDQDVKDKYEIYSREMRKIHDYLVNDFPEEKKLFTMKSGEFENLDFKTLLEAEKSFLDSLKKSNTVYVDFKVKLR